MEKCHKLKLEIMKSLKQNFVLISDILKHCSSACRHPVLIQITSSKTGESHGSRISCIIQRVTDFQNLQTDSFKKQFLEICESDQNHPELIWLLAAQNISWKPWISIFRYMRKIALVKRRRKTWKMIVVSNPALGSSASPLSLSCHWSQSMINIWWHALQYLISEVYRRNLSRKMNAMLSLQDHKLFLFVWTNMIHKLDRVWFSRYVIPERHKKFRFVYIGIDK